MLEKIFTSRTRVKLITLFTTTPEKDFYLRELERETNENVNSIRRELNNLEKMGLLKKKQRGNQKFYSINRNSPIFEDLKRIVLKTEGLGNELKNNLSRLGYIRYALIFGSFAKGEEIERSDIDLLIIGDVKEEVLLRSISKIERKVDREVNYILWSEQEFKQRASKKDNLLVNIVRNPIIGLIGDMNEFRKTVER